MIILENFYKETIQLFATSVETEMGFLLLIQWLDQLSDHPQVTSDHMVQVGAGDPNLSSTAYQYEKSLAQLLEDSKEGGINVRYHRYGVISLGYALWEEKYRQLIADDRGFPTKNDIQSDFFHDLNRYRQAILHANGKLDDNTKELTFFAKGESVSFTKPQMEELFDLFIQEINRIGQAYYDQQPDFQFHKPLI